MEAILSTRDSNISYMELDSLVPITGARAAVQASSSKAPESSLREGDAPKDLEQI